MTLPASAKRRLPIADIIAVSPSGMFINVERRTMTIAAASISTPTAASTAATNTFRWKAIRANCRAAAGRLP
jgi:hypothetical protein